MSNKRRTTRPGSYRRRVATEAQHISALREQKRQEAPTDAPKVAEREDPYTRLRKKLDQDNGR